jgi:ribosome-binding protein aMBF1 (putative translation factor)
MSIAGERINSKGYRATYDVEIQRSRVKVKKEKVWTEKSIRNYQEIVKILRGCPEGMPIIELAKKLKTTATGIKKVAHWNVTEKPFIWEDEKRMGVME